MSARSLVIAGPNRVLFGWLLGLSLGVAVMFGALTVGGIVDMSLQGLLVGMPAGCAGACAVVLAGWSRIGYDPRTKSLLAVGRKRFRPVFAKPAFVCVEYSRSQNRIYGVRPDGRRQRAQYPAWCYDQREWAAMVSRMPKAAE
ncbi:hypothetical protein GCM10009853_020630 [Glycomyces scopariae]